MKHTPTAATAQAPVPAPTIAVTFFNRANEPQGKPFVGSWPDFVATILGTARIEQRKDALPLFTGGRLRGDYRNAVNVEAISVVVLDIDSTTVQPEAMAQTMMMSGLASFIYTSPSHQPTAPRYRVVVPLSREHRPDEQYDLVCRLNTLAGGCAAAESLTCSLPYFYGCAADRGGHRMIYWTTDGCCLDRLPAFDQIPLTDPKPKANGSAGTGAALDPLMVETKKARSVEELREVVNRIPNDVCDWAWMKTVLGAIYTAGQDFPTETRQIALEWYNRAQFPKARPTTFEDDYDRQVLRYPMPHIGIGKLRWLAKEAEPTISPDSMSGIEQVRHLQRYKRAAHHIVTNDSETNIVRAMADAFNRANYGAIYRQGDRIVEINTRAVPPLPESERHLATELNPTLEAIYPVTIGDDEFRMRARECIKVYAPTKMLFFDWEQQIVPDGNEVAKRKFQRGKLVETDTICKTRAFMQRHGFNPSVLSDDPLIIYEPIPISAEQVRLLRVYLIEGKGNGGLMNFTAVHGPAFDKDGKANVKSGLVLNSTDRAFSFIDVGRYAGKLDISRSLEWAIGTLRDFINLFPYDDDDSASVLLSILLSQIAKPMCPTTPLHVIDAPENGTGKSFAVQRLTMIATGGKTATTINQSEDKAEFRKRVDSILMNGTSGMVLVDDITGGSLNSCDTLRTALTETGPMTVRVMGKNDDERAVDPTGLLWTVTGNNITLVLDMVRRSIRAGLNRVEAEQRGWRQADAFQRLVNIDDADILSAAMIVLAHIIENKPRCEVLENFEAWSTIVVPACDLVTTGSVLQTNKNLKADDPAAHWRGKFVTDMARFMGTGQSHIWTAKDLHTKLGLYRSHTEAREIVETLITETKANDIDQINTQIISGYLKRIEKHVTMDRSLRIARIRNERETRFSIERLDGGQDCSPWEPPSPQQLPGMSNTGSG